MIKFVEWCNELSVGIEEIDAQHQVLVELLNEAHQAIQQGRSAEAAKDLLDRLEEYARIHFADEEALLREIHYPDYERHKQDHDQFIGRLAEMRAKMAQGKGAVGFELAQFLKGWLTKHIMEVDKQYVPHYLEQTGSGKAAKASWMKKLWSR